ncbi:ABC transporter permease [Patulibacter minatonensis]|uniref:ABC transporter permease n=1 Tax=Patulibacter minatonensis TaxID=298163 RepID=UPI0012F81D87|nr:ABC transporter permease [Patulibacter minatonensis]
MSPATRTPMTTPGADAVPATTTTPTTKDDPTMTHATTTTGGARTRASTTRAILALAGSEVRLLVRNRLVATTALLIPLATAAGFGASGLRYGEGWGGTVAFMILTMLLLTVYIAATTAVAARRSGLVLKRMRSGETPEWAILTGMLLPTVGLAVVQSVLIGGMFLAFGAGLPENPALVLAAATGGAVLCAAFALATTRVTATPEMAQVTTMPFFFAALAGAFWIVSKPVDEATTLMLVNPGGAIMHLIQAGWDGGGDVLTAASALVFWAALGYEVAKRTFRWEPRS